MAVLQIEVETDENGNGVTVVEDLAPVSVTEDPTIVSTVNSAGNDVEPTGWAVVALLVSPDGSGIDAYSSLVEVVGGVPGSTVTVELSSPEDEDEG